MDLMRILLDAGSDANATTVAGFTPLSLVTTYHELRDRGIQIPMMQLLREHGADPNVGGRPNSALEEALVHGETGASEKLYRYGAKIDVRWLPAWGCSTGWRYSSRKTVR